MKYEKPEVQLLGSALLTIQGGKGVSNHQDSLPGQPVTFKTINAYAADE
jgi:hypothetical protein